MSALVSGKDAVARVESVKASSLPIVFECSIVYNNTREEVTVNVLRSEWAELGCGVGDYIDEDTIGDIDICAMVAGAAMHACRLLGYSDSSVRALTDKLRQRGYERDVARRAAEALEAAGYINEKDQIDRRGRMLSERKLHGLRRVVNELYAAGYKRENIRDWADGCDIDFGEICARAIAKRGGIPADADEKRKLISYLYRRGFSSDDIKRGSAAQRNR